MAEYLSRFYIIVSSDEADRSVGLFCIQMKVVMNQESFNQFLNIAIESLSDVLNRIVGYEGVVEDGYTRAEQIYTLHEAYDRIRNFFGEDADCTLDHHMLRSGVENTIDIIGNYNQPFIEFQIQSFPTFEFVQLASDRFNEIQQAFLRTRILA